MAVSKTRNGWILVAAACAAGFLCRDVCVASADWELVWSDEFDGQGIDRTKWDFDIGNDFYN